MTETASEARGPGRPRGANFESLSEYDKVEHVEAQLDRVIEKRSEQVARSSDTSGYEDGYQIMVAEYYRKAREERRLQWYEYHLSLSDLHQSLCEEHREKAQRLLGGEI